MSKILIKFVYKQKILAIFENLRTDLLLSSPVIVTMGVYFFKLDLVSDESDTEDQPDEWKKNRTLPPGARDQMRNYANKRGTNIKFM